MVHKGDQVSVCLVLVDVGIEDVFLPGVCE